MENKKTSLTKQSTEIGGTKSSISDDELLMLSQGVSFVGPFPDPKSLEHYNNIDPDFANRILKFTEENGTHRRELENIQVDNLYKGNITEVNNHHIESMSLIKQYGYGQIFAVVSIVLFLGSTLLSAYFGKDELSYILAGIGGMSTLTSIVNSFLKSGNSKNDNDKDNK